MCTNKMNKKMGEKNWVCEAKKPLRVRGTKVGLSDVWICAIKCKCN